MEEHMKNKKKQNDVEDGYVDVSKAERAIWLMKCPPAFAHSLSLSHANPSHPVAKIVVSIDPLNSNGNNDSQTQLIPELAGIEVEHIPKCYAMDMSNDFAPMSVFSYTTQQEKISVEGEILKKFNMRPHNQSLEHYGKICRERTNKYMVKSRKIHVLDNDTGAHMRPMPGMKIPARGSNAKRKRRERGEREEIEFKLFKLFEQKSNWSLKNLIHEIDTPEQFLKDILKDLCVYSNNGANHRTYELKPEYRKSGD